METIFRALAIAYLLWALLLNPIFVHYRYRQKKRQLIQSYLDSDDPGKRMAATIYNLQQDTKEKLSS